MRHVSSLSVQTHKTRVHVSRDGELMMVESPLEFRIHPGVLKIRL